MPVYNQKELLSIRHTCKGAPENTFCLMSVALYARILHLLVMLYAVDRTALVHCLTFNSLTSFLKYVPLSFHWLALRYCYYKSKVCSLTAFAFSFSYIPSASSHLNGFKKWKIFNAPSQTHITTHIHTYIHTNSGTYRYLW